MIKKGTKVWMFGDWNGIGACYYDQFVVVSFGKQQAALERVEDGKMLKQRVYAENYGDVVPADQFTNEDEVRAEAVRRGGEYRAETMHRLMMRLTDYRAGKYDGGNDNAYVNHTSAKLKEAADATPRALSRAECIAETKAAYRARHGKK